MRHCFCSGGTSPADAERLHDEPLARQLARVQRFADPTQLGEWLRKQTDASLAAFRQLISQFVHWVIARAEAARWTCAGRAEVFFDDTQSEVFGPTCEGAKINDHRDRARSWQTLWSGSFLLDGQPGSPGDVSRAPAPMLERHRHFWQERASDFPADSGSSSAGYLQAIAAAGFTHWSVSYNKWTTVPERTAAALPQNARRPALTTTRRDGTEVTEQHAGIRPTPGESELTFPLAVARWKKDGGMFWRYGFVAHDERRTDAPAVMARHRLKGQAADKRARNQPSQTTGQAAGC